jgi:uncharacterized protein
MPPTDRMARELRGFGPPGLFVLFAVLLTGTILIQQVAIPLGAMLVLLWVRLSKTPLCRIGYIKPKRPFKTILMGMLFGCLFKLFTKAVVMPLLGAGPVNLAYHYLAGNSALLPIAVWAMLVAGFAEETVFRGFLFERLGRLFGSHPWTKTAIILLTSALFGLAHVSQQGWMGGIHAALMGLTFGTIYAVTGRLFLLMIAHAAYDLTALGLIYCNLETAVAQFFFR